MRISDWSSDVCSSDLWRLVDDRLDVEDLAAAFAIQMQLDLADGVAVRCRNIFQKGSIFGGAAGVVNLPRPAQFDLALDHRPDWRDTDSARDENRMRRAFLERIIVRRRGHRKSVADPHIPKTGRPTR